MIFPVVCKTQELRTSRNRPVSDVAFVVAMKWLMRIRDAASLPRHGLAPVVEVPQAGLPVSCGYRVDDTRNALLDAKVCL